MGAARTSGRGSGKGRGSEKAARSLTVAGRKGLRNGNCGIEHEIIAEPGQVTFLEPATIAIAAGLTVPPLVALYFLKLKRAARIVPSTLLWRRAVEDLQVNAPFQRLRRNLLLLLQLMVLALAALALGKPLFEAGPAQESTMILMIDQSASMGVVEEDGRARLETAKARAKEQVEAMPDDARAMVLAFCDRATVVSSFDADKSTLKVKIDSIEQTQSTSSLAEAMNLAEAYAQNIIIGSVQAGSDVAPQSAAPPATVTLYTDGRIADEQEVAIHEFDVEKISVAVIGKRTNNVGIVSMEARRNYERSNLLAATAMIRNFGEAQAEFDAVLYVDGLNVDVQPVRLGPADGKRPAEGTAAEGDASAALVAFDEIEFASGGVVEVVLRIEDALGADDRAWAVVDPPRDVRILLVSPGNIFLENALAALPYEVQSMTGETYERADQRTLLDGRRSAFDLVIMDRHSTGRLPHGNYFFWGSVPEMEGVGIGERVANPVIFNWDETHPVLRHVAAETIAVLEWHQLTLPPEAVPIIEGATAPVLAYLARDASQYLLSAFALITEDDQGEPLLNTYWPTSVDFVVFMQNVVQYMSANVATVGGRSVTPGETISFVVAGGAGDARIVRPDGGEERLTVPANQTIHYGRTRQVGTYRLRRDAEAAHAFAVNLFSEAESNVAPAGGLKLGAAGIAAQASAGALNQPAWRFLLVVLLAVLALEWIVYNRRVRA